VQLSDLLSDPLLADWANTAVNLAALYLLRGAVVSLRELQALTKNQNRVVDVIAQQGEERVDGPS
jgi:hypothetical protein